MRRLILCGMVAAFLLLLTLSPAFSQDVQGDVYVEATVDNPNPYVGQQIVYSFKLYDAVGLTNPLYQPSDFEGFWRIDMGVVSQTTQQINGRQYSVTTISTALYPTHAGSITIQPSGVVLPETVFHPKQTLTANPIVLDVKPLPDGSPSDFNGAVGQFSMSASLDRQSVKVGEPIVMTLTISGTGNIEQLPVPTVPDNWRSTANAGSYKSAIQNGVVVGTRDYHITFIPSSAGSQQLPPITLDYFDPVNANYKSISTSPIQIQVVADDTDASPANAPQSVSEPSLHLKALGELSVNDANINPLLMIVAAFLPLCLVVVIGYQQRVKGVRERQRIISRQQQALQVATRDLKAVSLSDAKGSYQAIDDIFKRYVANKLNTNLDAIKQANVATLLSEKNVSSNVISKVQVFMSAVEEGLFSPSTEGITAQKRDELLGLLREIEKEWPR